MNYTDLSYYDLSRLFRKTKSSRVKIIVDAEMKKREREMGSSTGPDPIGNYSKSIKAAAL